MRPLAIGADKYAYEGDGHTDYEGSYRVLASYEFYWDGSTISDVSTNGAYGTTRLIQSNGLAQCVVEKTATEKVAITADDDPGRAGFRLRISSKNPLQPGAPNIDSQLDGLLIGTDHMSVDLKTDHFPSHGFAVYKNGQSVATAVDFDASCAPNFGPNAYRIADRLNSFDHKAHHDVDLRAANQKFFAPCEETRPPALSYPAR